MTSTCRTAVYVNRTYGGVGGDRRRITPSPLSRSSWLSVLFVEARESDPAIRAQVSLAVPGVLEHTTHQGSKPRDDRARAADMEAG